MEEHQLTGVGRNLANAARLGVQNLQDDPEFLLLQVLRKFGKHTAVRGALNRYAVRGRKPTVLALAALLREDRETVGEVIRHWLREDTYNEKDAARLANTAIAAGMWNEAEAVLDREEDLSAAVARSAARLHWTLGRMDEAIATLGKAGSTRGRQLAHYLSERNTFEGAVPVLGDRHRSWELGREPHVLYVATNSLPHTSSGYTQRTHSLLKALQTEGIKVSAATRVGYPVTVGNLLAPLSNTVDTLTYRRLLPARLRFDLTGRMQQQAELLAALVEELKPSILHTTTDFTNAVAVRAVARAYSLPWVYEVRGQLADTWASTRPGSARQSLRHALFRKREAENAKAADAVITLGAAMRTNLVDAGVPAENIQVLPNGVGEEFLDEPLDKLEARHLAGLESGRTYVGTISSLVPYEGLDLLVRLVALMAPTHPDLRLLIVGDGTEREPLIDLAHKMGVSQRCVFTGRVPREKAHIYHAALDVFMVPRRDLAVTRDVTPLKPVEAMASAVPVMASDLPALAELITHGETGLLVTAEDVEAWAKALGELLENNERRARIGADAREFVLRERTWAKSSAILKQIYWSKSMRR